MTGVKLLATHAINVSESLICELVDLKASIVDECSLSKTVFCLDVEDNVDVLLQLRHLRYADELFLEIYHNRMSPSKEHPDCPVEMRGYLSLLFYSINYVPEISRCLELLRKLNKHLNTITDDQITINFVLLTTERSSAWKNGLQIVLEQLPRHIKCAMKESNQRWSTRFHDKMYKSEDEITVVIFADRYDIYAGVLLFDEEDFRPHLTFWQLNGSIAATVVELADINDGDIVLDMACDYGELTLEVLRNRDCFCIAMSPKIDQLAMAEVNWVGLQNQLKKEAGERARHLQFIAVEFNKDFFNFNVVNKILCSLPLKWWKIKGETLDLYYDKVFTIISKCRQETHSVLLIPLMKDHKRRVKDASASKKYNFQVLEIRRLMTRTIQLYVCLLETKLPCLAFPERRVDLLVPQDEFLSPPLNLTMSQDSLLQRTSSLNLPPVPNHFMRHSLCLSMSNSSNSMDPPSSSLDLAISRSPLQLPPLLCANRQMMGSNNTDIFSLNKEPVPNDQSVT
ncbi:hypothetical protein GCK32_006404 [Trichostrongylus colubriformis]|uniref:Uncharacterized protein n=1 Tax=Trichostrongylus colubriformis TaxID=6319 RepID=A0AAN8F7F6_TRICO